MRLDVKRGMYCRGNSLGERQAWHWYVWELTSRFGRAPTPYEAVALVDGVMSAFNTVLWSCAKMSRAIEIWITSMIETDQEMREMTFSVPCGCGRGSPQRTEADGTAVSLT